MAGVLLSFVPGPAAEAQTLEELRARVAALEAREAEQGRVIVPSGTTLEIGGRAAAGRLGQTSGGRLNADPDKLPDFTISAAWRGERASLPAAAVLRERTAPGDTEQLQTIHASLFYKPTAKLTVGGELIWGERELANGQSVDASRIQTSVQFNF